MISDELLTIWNSDKSWNFTKFGFSNFCNCCAPQFIVVGSSAYEANYLMEIFSSDYKPAVLSNFALKPQTRWPCTEAVDESLPGLQARQLDSHTQASPIQGAPRYTLMSPAKSDVQRFGTFQPKAPGSDQDFSDDSSSRYNKTPKMFDESIPTCSEYLKTKFVGHEGKLVGFYTQRERRNKINHLRQKLMKHKMECPINKLYKGRSKAARSKVRFWGKFVKSELAEKYADDDMEVYKRNALIDKYVTANDFQKAVNVLAEY